MDKLFLLPDRTVKYVMRKALEIAMNRSQIKSLAKRLLLRFPALQVLKSKVLVFANVGDNGLKKYTDIDCLLKDMRTMEEKLAPADAMKAMCEVYLVLDPTANELAKSDPFSPEYSLAAMRLYEKLSGVKGYDPGINELTPYIDVAQSVRSPSPYGYGTSKVVGDFLSSWGWIFQVLNVKAGDKVLEYGAGEGQLSIMLARMGADVTVIDIDERYLECIRAQCDSLGITITLKQGKFGDGFEDKKFDRILFFEAFHHSFDHRDVIEKLKPHLTEGGFVVFSGEPIVVEGSVEASFVPFPWGPRLDGISIRSTNRFGWCELGFQQSYFIEMLMRAGFLVTYSPCPVTGRGNCYIATPSTGQINLGASYALSISGEDSGWHPPEGNHRWTKGHAYLTLPLEINQSGGHVTLLLANYLPVERIVTVGTKTIEKTCSVKPGSEQSITVSLPPSRYLEIRTPSVIPSTIIPGCFDSRELGIAVVRVQFHLKR